jgi:hypothetical protein
MFRDRKSHPGAYAVEEFIPIYEGDTPRPKPDPDKVLKDKVMEINAIWNADNKRKG